MHHPFQLIQAAPASKSRPTPFLLAASGSVLLVFDLQDGTISSKWQALELKTENASPEEEAKEPASKKRRVDKTESPSIGQIAVHEGHVVVGTVEDKSVRVFSLSANGDLEPLSQRQMAKRPAALAILDETIICADKFGDVYSLPLLPTKEEDEEAEKAAMASSQKLVAPAATSLTVHSQSNLRSLEFQQKQLDEKKLIDKAKDPMAFAYKLLLGHVSMTTAILIPEIMTEEGRKRRYIITSDRDEHIRVSRGPPQAYIIENYCFGHKEFVSSLCLATPELLISGGGDDHLFIWDWQRGALVSKINLAVAVAKVLQIRDSGRGPVPTTVSGLWILDTKDDKEARVLIACEAVPALFHCRVAELTKPDISISSIPLDGNLLSLAVLDDAVFVSVDNIHTPGTKEVDGSATSKSRITCLKIGAADDAAVQHTNRLLTDANQLMTMDWEEDNLKTLLYNVHILRKRRDGRDEE